jgi:hypothetical protein
LSALNSNHTQIKEAVEEAVRVSNIDISNFASQDVGIFVSNTWELCLEGNPIFRNSLYTVQQYRTALQKVERFQGQLKIDTIFKRYGDEPSVTNYQRAINRAASNLVVEMLYIQAKLVEIGMLEAIALLTGGDAPFSLFVGELPQEGKPQVSALENYFDPFIAPVEDPDRNLAVLKLLKAGRPGPTHFDFAHSPLATYVYERMSILSFYESVQNTQKFYLKKMEPLEYLKAFPQPLMQAILNAISQIAWSRHDDIIKLLA